MEKEIKWIFIGIGLLLIMVVGVIVFLYFTAPEILTKTPLELITGRVIQDKENKATPPLTESASVTDDFIVSDELWKNAFRLNLANGSPLMGAVGFSRLPIGTELRAPLDGYVSEGSITFPSGENVLSLQWTFHERRPGNMGETKITFDVSGAEILNRSPRKGEVFARITGNTPIGAGFYDREVVFVIRVAPADFEFQTDRAIEDPRAYIQKAIEKLN